MTNSFYVTVRVPDDGDPFGENDERLDALYEAGCDDATVSSNGRDALTVSFDRPGTMDEAVASAVADICRAIPGAEISKIVFEEAA